MRRGQTLGILLVFCAAGAFATIRYKTGAPEEAARLYHAGRYADARHHLQDPQQGPASSFLLGAVLYRQGDYTAAAENFGAAAGDPRLRQAALYNRGNCYYHLASRAEGTGGARHAEAARADYAAVLAAGDDPAARHNLAATTRLLARLSASAGTPSGTTSPAASLAGNKTSGQPAGAKKSGAEVPSGVRTTDPTVAMTEQDATRLLETYRRNRPRQSLADRRVLPATRDDRIW